MAIPLKMSNGLVKKMGPNGERLTNVDPLSKSFLDRKTTAKFHPNAFVIL